MNATAIKNLARALLASGYWIDYERAYRLALESAKSILEANDKLAQKTNEEWAIVNIRITRWTSYHRRSVTVDFVSKSGVVKHFVDKYS
jgi:hypothetical protein